MFEFRVLQVIGGWADMQPLCLIGSGMKPLFAECMEKTTRLRLANEIPMTSTAKWSMLEGPYENSKYFATRETRTKIEASTPALPLLN